MEQLLTTKLFVPAVRPDLVSRPRLIERLNKGLRKNQAFGRKLTLVSAPAGFGKTTLVSECFSHLYPRRSAVSAPPSTPPRIAWLSLDEGDNDLTRFLTYLVTALQTSAPSPVKGPILLSVAATTKPLPTSPPNHTFGG